MAKSCNKQDFALYDLKKNSLTPAVGYFMSWSSGSGDIITAPDPRNMSYEACGSYKNRQFSRTRSSAGTDINGIMPAYPKYRFGFQVMPEAEFIVRKYIGASLWKPELLSMWK